MAKTPYRALFPFLPGYTPTSPSLVLQCLRECAPRGDNLRAELAASRRKKDEDDAKDVEAFKDDVMEDQEAVLVGRKYSVAGVDPHAERGWSVADEMKRVERCRERGVPESI